MKLSIIICTHNRRELVKNLALSFNDQSSGYVQQFEIIVVANACTDDTYTVLNKIKAHIKFPLIIINESKPGLSIARNRGLENASGDVICFLDDDIKLVDNWLDGMGYAFYHFNHEIIGGRISLWFDNIVEPPWLHYYHKRLLGLNDHGNKIINIDYGNIFGGNFGIRSSVYKKIGGFSDSFGRKGKERLAGEEADYFLRAKEFGFKFLYTPFASVEHLVNADRITIEYLTKSAFGVGKSRVLLPNRIDNISISTIFEKLSGLIEETINEKTSETNQKDYLYHKTRRFDFLGEAISSIKYIFGETHDNFAGKYDLDKLKSLNTEINNLKLFYSNIYNFDVSIIIPCFNSSNFIKKALDSIVNQSVNQDCFEVIIIDDCSQDNTLEKIKLYTDKIKNLSIYKQPENKKQGAARNVGIRKAKGKFILFLDSDDWLHENALKLLLDHSTDRDIVIGQHNFVSNKGIRTSNRTANDSIYESFLSGTTGWWPFGILIKAELAKANLFREGVYFEDIDFVINIAKNTQKHSVIKDVVYFYLERQESTVNSLDMKKINDTVSAILAVQYTLTTNTNQDLIWKNSGARWIIYQIKRIIQQNICIENSIELLEKLFLNLNSRNLIEYFGYDFLKNFDKEIYSFFKNEENYINNNLKIGNYFFKNKAYSISYYYYSKFLTDNKMKTHAMFNIDFCKKRMKKDFLKLKCTQKFFSPIEVDYLFIPHNYYHAKSFVNIANDLKEYNVKSLILNTLPVHPDEGQFIKNFDQLYCDLSSFIEEQILPRGIVVMNDWEPHIASSIVLWANNRGLSTYGIVEGVNDFHDVDTGLNRNAYKKVKNLYLNGNFDRKYFSKSKQNIDIVGIERLGDVLYKKNKNSFSRKIGTAVANCNFTYGVLENYAAQWCSDVSLACNKNGYNLKLNKHHADNTIINDIEISSSPLYDDLFESEIFITRFSGAVFEALIAGSKVIYYNPGIEKIDKFIDPLGAYLYASNFAELVYSLKMIKNGWNPDTKQFLQEHANVVFNDSNEPIIESRITTIDLLMRDSLKNRKKMEKDKNGGHRYFEEKFCEFRTRLIRNFPSLLSM